MNVPSKEQLVISQLQVHSCEYSEPLDAIFSFLVVLLLFHRSQFSARITMIDPHSNAEITKHQEEAMQEPSSPRELLLLPHRQGVILPRPDQNDFGLTCRDSTASPTPVQLDSSVDVASLASKSEPILSHVYLFRRAPASIRLTCPFVWIRSTQLRLTWNPTMTLTSAGTLSAIPTRR